MAGPFDTGSRTAEIADVQLKGGYAPTPGVAGAIDQALGVALPAIREAHTKSLQEDVKNQTQSVRDALLAARNPAIAQSLFREEALANPITAQAFKEFNRIKDAAAQGVLPQQFALERLEVIQNEAIANAPEFEQEIRAAMVQATGQDPSRTLFGQLLSQTKQQLTAEQKAQEKLIIDATQNGLTPEQQQEINHAVAINQLEQARLGRKKAMGTYGLLDITADVNSRAGGIMLDLVGQIRQETVRTGGVTPEFMTQVKQQASQAITASIAQIQASATGVDGAQVAAAIAPLEKMLEQIDGMAEDGSLQQLVASKNTISKALLEQDILALPDFAAAWTFGGQRGFIDMLNYLEKAPNPQSQQLLSTLSPGAQTAFTLRNITAGTLAREYGRLGSGINPRGAEETNGRALAATIVMGTRGMEEGKHATALAELQAIDEELAWGAFDSRKVLQATAESKTLQAGLVSMQQTVTAGLGVEWAELKATPGVDARKFSFDGDVLEYKFDVQNLRGVNNEAMNAVRGFVDRFNRANRISAKHMKAGNLPGTRYSGTQDYWGVVTTAVEGAQAEEPAPTVIRWGRDDNGKPIRLD